jgi:hypothetical protein
VGRGSTPDSPLRRITGKTLTREVISEIESQTKSTGAKPDKRPRRDHCQKGRERAEMQALLQAFSLRWHTRSTMTRNEREDVLDALCSLDGRWDEARRPHAEAPAGRSPRAFSTVTADPRTPRKPLLAIRRAWFTREGSLVRSQPRPFTPSGGANPAWLSGPAVREVPCWARWCTPRCTPETSTLGAPQSGARALV